MSVLWHNLQLRESTQHQPALDGIRGIAVIAVLLSHVGGLGEGRVVYYHPLLVSGWCGVDLFFVLSGYLITGILLRTKDSANRAASFYMRRILRIFPLYYLVLITVLVVGSFVPYFGTAASPLWQDRIGYFFYFQSIAAIWHGNSRITALGHFWSLAVEEQFYLVWPFLVWSLSKLTMLRLSVAVCVLDLLLRIALVAHFGPHFWLFSSPCRGDGLIMGGIVAILTSTGERISKRGLALTGACGAAILLFILFADRHEFANTDAGPYICTIGITGYALMFAALVGASQYCVPVLSGLLRLSLLRNIGKYSYGMYVYHIPLFLIIFHYFGRWLPMKLVPAIGATFLMCLTSYLVARISYSLIELPFLRVKDAFQASRPANNLSR